MSVGVSSLAKIFTKSSKAIFKAELVHELATLVNSAKKDLDDYFKTEVKGAILINGIHPSTTDPTPHYTVDVYGPPDEHGFDKPMGVLHLYPAATGTTRMTMTPFDNPRTKANDRYYEKLVNAGITPNFTHSGSTPEKE